LRGLAKNAEAVDGLQRWREILARAFQVFLQWPSVALAATLRTRLTQQLLVEKSQKISRASNSNCRI